MPTARLQIARQLFRQSNKHSVRFNRKDDVDLGLAIEPLGKLPGLRIGVLRHFQPNVVPQNSDPRRRQKRIFDAS